jgi:cell division protein FtsL
VALLAFVVTAVIVVWRRTSGRVVETAVADLDQQRRDLEAQIARLESDLREAMSASQIEPAAARKLGLRRATDSQLVTLSRAATRPAVQASDSIP